MSDWVIEYGLNRLKAAQAEIAEVELLLLRGRRKEAEETARSSLRTFASAMNWLEDTDHFDNAHRLLDLAGKYVRLTFGCWLHRDGKSYEQRCPVALAHKRIGFSPELVVTRYTCTICGEDAATCPHIVGRDYDGVMCGRQASEIGHLSAIAWVRRPAQPDARLHSITVSVDDLRSALPKAWKPGMPVSCDRCLEDCEGVEEFDFDELAPSPEDDPAAWEPDETTSGSAVLMLANTPMR
jgi:hypothetical protein